MCLVVVSTQGAHAAQETKKIHPAESPRIESPSVRPQRVQGDKARSNITQPPNVYLDTL